MVYEAEVVDAIVLTDKDKDEAGWAKLAVDSLLVQIHSSESILRRDFAQLGTLLLRIRTKKYWQEWGFESFGGYIDSIKDKISKGRTQLYGYISVADKLLPFIDSEDLGDMGISKATLLAQSVSKTGRAPADSILEAAKNPNVDAAELKSMLFTNENPESGQLGKYYDFGGCYLTVDERAELEQAFEIAKHTDPIIPNDWPSHVQIKEIMLRFAREFVSTYGALVKTGTA